MGYGLAPSQQSADTETGATPSLGESFLVQFFACICILYFRYFNGGKNQLVVRLRVGRWPTLLGDINVTDD